MEPLNVIDRMVGRRIRERRHQLNIGRDALAADLEVAAAEIDRYEDGQARVSAAQLFMLTQLLDVRVSYFFRTFDDPVGRPEFYIGTPARR